MQPAADPAAARPTSVLDASALLALAHGEDGEQVVADAIDEGAAIGIVNLAEVLSKLADRACLALAARLGVPALTADRAWADVDTGAEVRLTR